MSDVMHEDSGESSEKCEFTQLQKYWGRRKKTRMLIILLSSHQVLHRKTKEV